MNPLAGLHPEHSDLPFLCTQVGIPYVELIRRIVDSTLTRVRDGVEIRLGPPRGPKKSGPARFSRKS